MRCPICASEDTEMMAGYEFYCNDCATHCVVRDDGDKIYNPEESPVDLLPEECDEGFDRGYANMV